MATEKAIEVDPGNNINAVNQRDQFIQEQGNKGHSQMSVIWPQDHEANYRDGCVA